MSWPVPLMTPDNVVEALLTSAVSVPLPRATLPAPEIDPAVCAKLFRLKVAPVATEMSDAEDMRLAAPSVSVPALIDVNPVYVLTPESVIAPVPIFVNPPVPLITPVNVVAVLLPPVVRVPAPRAKVPPVV